MIFDAVMKSLIPRNLKLLWSRRSDLNRGPTDYELVKCIYIMHSRPEQGLSIAPKLFYRKNGPVKTQNNFLINYPVPVFENGKLKIYLSIL